MTETKEKKGFRAGLYAVVSCVLVGAILVGLTVYAFTSRYTAFSPEKVARAYVDCIVQTGDGYNAYKNTLVSKNMKYGDFIIDAYMNQFVNDGEDVKQANFVGTGNAQEIEMKDNVYDTMYDYYKEILVRYGMDDYDSIFNNYFTKLVEVRNLYYGDEYMDTEYMFGVFESNVVRYGQELTGTQRVFASDNVTIIQEETEGLYQQKFGDEQEVEVEALVDGKKQTVTETQKVYKLTTTVTSCEELSADEVTAYVAEYKTRIDAVIDKGLQTTENAHLDEEKTNSMRDAYNSLDCSESITGVAKAKAEVTDQNGNLIVTQELYVVKIGNSWYVDNTNVDTSALYEIV